MSERSGGGRARSSQQTRHPLRLKSRSRSQENRLRRGRSKDAVVYQNEDIYESDNYNQNNLARKRSAASRSRSKVGFV